MPEPDHPDGARLRLHLLVLRCQAGDERAFGRLFEMFGDRTLAYLRGLVGDDAEDVQQEVWLSVYRHVGALARPGAFRAWLFQATRHRALDFLRRRKREARLVEETAAELATTDAGEDDEPAELPDRLGGLDLAALAARLPAVQGEVLLLRYANDLSYGEIALVMGCSTGTVKSRLHNARRRVQALIHDTL